MMKRGLALLVFLLVTTSLWGQTSPYAVVFTEKQEVDERLSYPQDFLSQRALDRRARAGISPRAQDVPIHPDRLAAVRGTVTYLGPHSKWLNTCYVEATPAEVLALLEWPFVASVKPVSGGLFTHTDIDLPIAYGETEGQIQQISLDVGPHRGRSYLGESMLIAVLDAGFVGGNTVNFTDLPDPVVFTKNYVEGGSNVYQGSSHGFSVLSTMAAFKEGSFVGTAPMASYTLFKTEDEGSETPQEMFNWVAAAEFADSMGADIINSSLGYYEFDDPADDYSIADLDGRTSIISLGALAAARTGMLVVTSAGNAGGSAWGKLTFPADADSILTVGSVNRYGIASSFTSPGYTADGRIKPNVSARGEGAAVMRSDGTISLGNGTSFSSPIVAGAAASLWDMVPEATAQQVLQAIETSASSYYQPNPRIGRGVPNFAFAAQFLKNTVQGTAGETTVYPNPFPDYMEFYFPDAQEWDVILELYDLNDRLIASKTFEKRKFQALWAPGDHVPGGVYLLRIQRGNRIEWHRVIKLQ